MSEKDVARREIMAKWRRLPPEQRASDSDAAAFAMQMAREYDFPTKGVDRYQVINGWLKGETGRP